MVIAQWIAGSLLILFGGFIAVMNWWILIRTMRDKQGVSFAPLLGGILLMLGLLLLPVDGLRTWCWVGLLLDFGSLPLLFWAIVEAIKGR